MESVHSTAALPVDLADGAMIVDEDERVHVTKITQVEQI